MADKQLVLAFFPDEAAADSAADALKDSGIAHGDAIGILALDSHGKLKTDKVGARSTGKGAAIGGSCSCSGRRSWGSASSAARWPEPSITRTWACPTPTRRASPSS
jgi:hypothetical protein